MSSVHQVANEAQLSRRIKCHPHGATWRRAATAAGAGTVYSTSSPCPGGSARDKKKDKR